MDMDDLEEPRSDLETLLDGIAAMTRSTFRDNRIVLGMSDTVAWASALETYRRLRLRDKHSLYVASSWRNARQPQVVSELREAGYRVYDFRNPVPGNLGFSWSQIDPNWKNWSIPCYLAALDSPEAREGYRLDYDGMRRASAGVLVMPCGRSAHLEAGYFVGAGKPLVILLDPGTPAEPELMYKMAQLVTTSIPDAIGLLDSRLA